MNPEIKPAATVVVIREADANAEAKLEVLLLKRNSKLAFAASSWVFPGGKVDDEELSQSNNDIEAAYICAAIRECREETQLELDDQSLLPISHWTTPKFRSRRFSTQFFISRAPLDHAVQIDQSEIVDHQWLTPLDALDQHRAGEIEFMPPAVVTLSELDQCRTYAEVEKFYSGRKFRSYKPRAVVHNKDKESFHATMLYEGDSGYETNNHELDQQLNRCVIRNNVTEHVCNWYE